MCTRNEICTFVLYYPYLIQPTSIPTYHLSPSSTPFSYVARFTLQTMLFMIMEFCSGGELFDHIKRSPGGALGEDEACRLFIDLMEGLKHCHDRKIAHRDLKTENLLIDNLTGM